MKVYIVYSQNDSQFVEKLRKDLESHGFDAIVALPMLADIPTAIAQTDVVLLVLSDAISEDDATLRYLDTIKAQERQLIALRTGAVATIPDAVRGMLPVDFSSEDQYQDSLETLLEDLDPPTVKLPRQPLLPESLQERLESSILKERMEAIQRLGELRHDLDNNQRNYIEDKLRRIVFKDDTHGSLKTVARSTLQLLNTPEPTPVAEQEPSLVDADTAKMPLTLTPSPSTATESVLQQRQTAVSETTTVPSASSTYRLVVYSDLWWTLPIFGVLLALLQSALQREALSGLPVALVWLALPWFNVAIRDGGQLDWKMPGPLIGNGAIGLILGFVGSIILLLIGNIETFDLVLISLLGTLYGTFIGWLSSLYTA